MTNNASAQDPTYPTPLLKLGWDAPAPATDDEPSDAEPDSADPPSPTALTEHRSRMRPTPVPWMSQDASGPDDGPWLAATGTEQQASTPPRVAREPAGGPGESADRGGRDRGPRPPQEPVGFPAEGGASAAAEASSEPFINAVRSRGTAPKLGWRAAFYRMTGVNPGVSTGEQRLLRQQSAIRTRMDGPHSVVVSSMKGGVGKTTVSALLGLLLAEERGERVVAVDANPDAGTLADRLVGQTRAAQLTVRKLLNHIDEVHTFSDLSDYVHLVNRLQVVASEQVPEASEAFSQSDYEAVLDVLSRFCQVLITDSGTGITHSAMQGGLARADSLVIVGSLTQDASSRAASTWEWLASRRWAGLAERAVVVFSLDRESSAIEERRILNYFQDRCRAVLTLPADPHLKAGGPIDLDALRPSTMDAAREIVATVAEGFYPCPTSLGRPRPAERRRRDMSW